MEWPKNNLNVFGGKFPEKSSREYKTEISESMPSLCDGLLSL